KSRRILYKVVVSNKLNIIYNAKGNVKKSELLEQESPVKLVLLDSNNPNQDSITYQIKISVDNNSKITVSDGIQNIVGYNYGKKIITPIGAIMFVPNKDKKLDQNLVIDVIPA